MTLSALSPAQAQAQDTGEAKDSVSYVFKPNDTLIGLANRYFKKPDDYKIVQRINAIANPRKIPVGTNVVVPIRLLKIRQAKARIAAYRGQIAITDNNGRALSVRTGQSLAEASRISTGSQSSLSLSLDDGSIITLPSNSAMRITRLRTILMTGSVDYEFALDKGGVRSKVKPFRNAQDRYNVRTPVAVSAVRGTDFRNRYEADSGRALAELIEGGLELDTGIKAGNIAAPSTRLESAFGAIIGQSGTTTEALLPAPLLTGRFSMQTRATANFSVVNVPDATGYRLQIARDSNFIDILDDRTSPSPEMSVVGLPPGHYFGKITAFAPSGLEGMPSNFAFTQDNSTDARAASDGFIFRWTALDHISGKTHYRFQLYRANLADPRAERPPVNAVPVVDEAALRETSIILSDLDTGSYFWRVGSTHFSAGSLSESWSDYTRFQVVK